MLDKLRDINILFMGLGIVLVITVIAAMAWWFMAA